MKLIALIINAFVFPGIGSILMGKNKAAAAQIALFVIGVLFSMTFVGLIVGLPLIIIAWAWGLVTVAKAEKTEESLSINYLSRGSLEDASIRKERLGASHREEPPLSRVKSPKGDDQSH